MAHQLDQVDLAALCSGDKRAWDGFVPAAAAVIKAVARRILLASGNEQETADVMQEVFVRLSRDGFRLLRGFDAARASLSTWLGVITTGTALDLLRRKRHGEVPLDDVAEEQLGVVQHPGRQRITLPPDLLSPRQALILVLLYEHDLTPEEAGELLGIEAQTVRSQRHKAFARLRTAWSNVE